MIKFLILNLLVVCCFALEQPVEGQQKDGLISLNNAPIMTAESGPLDIKSIPEELPISQLNDEQAEESLDGAEQRWGWGGYGGYGRGRWGGYRGYGGYGGFGGWGGGYNGYGRGYGGWGRGWGGYGGWGRRSFGYWG